MLHGHFLDMQVKGKLSHHGCFHDLCAQAVLEGSCRVPKHSTRGIGSSILLRKSLCVQVLTPAITLAICAMFGLERLTASLLTSIFLITAGTGAATAVEVGVAGFAWMGFLSFLLSILLEAGRVVYIQLLLGKLNYNAMEVRLALLPCCVALSRSLQMHYRSLW